MSRTPDRLRPPNVRRHGGHRRRSEMGKVTTGATMSIDGYIAGPNESGFDLLFQWYNGGDVEIRTGNPDLTFRTSAASAAALEGTHVEHRRAACRPASVRLRERLGWPASDGRDHGRADPPAAAGPAGRRRELRVRHRRHRGGRRHRQEDRRGQERRRQRRSDGESVPRRGPAGRDLRRPGAGDPRRRHPVLQLPGGQAGPARRADLGGRGHRRHPPRRTAYARTRDRRAAGRGGGARRAAGADHEPPGRFNGRAVQGAAAEHAVRRER